MEVSRTAVVTAIEDAGMDPDDVLREGYSGRSMYGDKTWGIVGNMTGFATFLVEFAKAEGEDADGAQELAGHVQSDSMGWDLIFYFPGVQLVGD